MRLNFIHWLISTDLALAGLVLYSFGLSRASFAFTVFLYKDFLSIFIYLTIMATSHKVEKLRKRHGFSVLFKIRIYFI